jgi:hypothetical protein
MAEWCWANVVGKGPVRDRLHDQDTQESPLARPTSLRTSSPQTMVRSNLSISPSEGQSGQVDRSVSTFDNQNETAHDEIFERSAIVENAAGIPPGWAEGYAQLDPDRPPADVPLRRWVQFIDDIGRFFDRGLAEKAATLGWTALDLFGCDRDKPFARIDRQGLCWLIAGSRLVDLSETAAIIERWTGARQTWRRKPNEPGRVLAWELLP